MDKLATPPPCRRILVILPSWLGDAVMATPTLRALRELYPEAHITALAKPSIRPILDPCPWVNRITTTRSRRHQIRSKAADRQGGILNLARRLAKGRFDTAILLPNSFRAALLARLAGIDRRIGYDRDSRGVLLTDRLLPRRVPGGYVPVPTRDYYLGIARYLDAKDPDPTLELHTRPEYDAAADECLARAGYGVNDARPLVLLNPGANYGAAKMWPAERFSKIADECAKRYGAVVAVTGAPRERSIIANVIAFAHVPVLDLQAIGIDLPLLKSAIRRARVLVTNDTGPRHIAAALGVPVVTVFGPTNPAWTEIDFAHERQVRVHVECGPCQQKTCPLKGTDDFHICMKRIDPDMVMAQVADLLAAPRAHADQSGPVGGPVGDPVGDPVGEPTP